MSSEENTKKCSKCGHLVGKNIYEMHIARCPGNHNNFSQNNNENINNSNQLPKNDHLQNQNLHDNNSNININEEYNKSEVLEKKKSEEIKIYKCPLCNNEMLESEKDDHVLGHELQNEEFNNNDNYNNQNNSNVNNDYNNNFNDNNNNGLNNYNNYNNNNNNNYNNYNNYNNNNNNNNYNNYNNNSMFINNNVSVSRTTLPNGNIKEIKLSNYPNGNKIETIIYDRNGNIIQQNTSINNNNNNFNGQNNYRQQFFNNNNNNYNNNYNNYNNNNNNSSHHITTDPYGNVHETIITRNNGIIEKKEIIKDRNGNIISTSINSTSDNNNNNNNTYNNFIYHNNNNNNNNNINNNMRNLNSFFDSFNSMFQNNPLFRNIIDFNSSRNFMDIIDQLQNSNRHPVSEDIISQLPEFDVDVSKLDEEKKTCVICLQDFNNGEKATILPCFHIFHTECIKNWFENENTCPICKFKLTMDNLNSQGDDN